MYTFRELSDYEFEDFAKDVLTQYIGVDFRMFRKGKDGGVDLIDTLTDKKTIVQVKHYPNSSFSNLRTSMKSEFDKITKYKMERYILFTSFDMSVANTKEILEISNGLINTIDDIFDLSRINTIISSHEYSWIEEKHYKIWITNVAIMSRVLHNAQTNDISTLATDIKEEIKAYVYSEVYYCALQALEKNNLLIIHGIPGVGKTVLAKMLVWRYLEKGYLLKFVTGNNIESLQEVLSLDKDANEIIFIYDFLGANILDLIAGNSENKLVAFLHKYRNNTNKRVVLTTRTTIMKSATEYYEKLDRLFSNVGKYCIEINGYNNLEKARIFYNHCYFNIASEAHMSELIKNKRYMQIVKHKNYNPRIIEYICSRHVVTQIGSGEYYQFIMQRLNDPESIWEHEYREKITDECRFLVDTMFSLKDIIEMSILSNAFEERYSYEIRENSFHRKYGSFQRGIRILSESFLRISIDKNMKNNISFANPSVVDYLTSKYRKEPNILIRVFIGIHYIEQYIRLGVLSKDRISLVLSDIIKDTLLTKFDHLEFVSRESDKIIFLHSFINKYYPNDSLLLFYEEKILREKIYAVDGDYYGLCDVIMKIISNTDSRPSKRMILENILQVTILILEHMTNFIDLLPFLQFMRDKCESKLKELICFDRSAEKLADNICIYLDENVHLRFIENLNVSEFYSTKQMYKYEYQEEVNENKLTAEIDDTFDDEISSCLEEIDSLLVGVFNETYRKEYIKKIEDIVSINISEIKSTCYSESYEAVENSTHEIDDDSDNYRSSSSSDYEFTREIEQLFEHK